MKTNKESIDIQLWFLSYSNVSAKILAHCYAVLNAEEKQQYKQYKLAKVATQYLLTRFLLRTLLSKYMVEVEPIAWEFNKNQYGKPYIAYPQLKDNLFFNISHTSGAIVIAIGRYPDIGVDIELLRTKVNALEIAENVFSPVELQYLQRLPLAKQQESFFDFWTFKEAYIKALGKGLALPMDQFSFSFSADKTKIEVVEQLATQANNWRFWGLTFKDNYKIALAVKVADNFQQPLVVQLQEFSLTKLTANKSNGI